MSKTNFLQIRLTPEDRKRVGQAADAAHLDVSTWARQKILIAVEESEAGAARERPAKPSASA